MTETSIISSLHLLSFWLPHQEVASLKADIVKLCSLFPCCIFMFTVLLSLMLGVSLHPWCLKEQLSQRHLGQIHLREKKTACKETGGPVGGKYLKDYLFLKDQRDKAVGAAESFTPACMQGAVLVSKPFISTGLKKETQTRWTGGIANSHIHMAEVACIIL